MANKQIRLNQIQQDGATSNQVIQWNGSTWLPGTAASSYTNEDAQDAVGTILVDSGRIDFTYNDITPSITADIITNSVSNTYLTAGTGGSYKGSGTIAAGTTSTLTTSSTFGINFANADPAIYVQDTTGYIELWSKVNTGQQSVINIYPTYLELQGGAFAGDVSELFLQTGSINARTSVFTIFSEVGTAELRLKETTANGGSYTAFKVGSQTGNITYILPATDGTNGQYLKFTTGGQLIWDTPASGGTPAGSSFQVQYNNAGAFGAEANFNYDPATDRLVVGTTTATATLHGRAPSNNLSDTIFRAENLSANDIFAIRADGYWKFGDNENYPRFYQSVSTGGSVSYTGLGITADVSFLATGAEDGFGVSHPSLTVTAGTKNVFKSTGTWAPNTGSASYYSMIATPTINQSSTYTGISVGLGIIPTLTSVAVGQFWGIYLDINNSNAYGIYQNGVNSSNYFNGSVAIGSSTMAGSSALLQIDSSTKGFLLPRMIATQRTAIGTPATGLMVYQTDATENLYIKKSSAWKRILTEDDGGVTLHHQLGELLDDDHTQYALLAGRTTTQTINGGTTATGTLQLRGTINATPGNVAINGVGGNVTIGGGSTASELWFYEPSGSGSNYTAFKAQAQGSSLVYTLPAAVPTTSGQFLSSTTGGVMSWTLDRSTYAEVNSQSGTTYTLILSDAGKTIDCTSLSAVTFTIPTNASVAFPTGTLIHVIQSNTGQITFGGAGVSINSADSKLKTRVRYSTVTLQKTATDTWLLFGDITT